MQMKKILILTMILVLHLLPGTGKEGSLYLGQPVAAQIIPCPNNPNGPGCNGSGGGSFWDWLSNLVNNIGQAIANFFANAGASPGSGTGEWLTDENDGWNWTSDGWLPGQIDYGGSGPYDPWADSYWQQLGFSSGDWNVLNNWQYYYNQYSNGNPPPPPPPGRYYIKVAFDGVTEDTTKYYEGDTIYTMERHNPIKLTVYRENGTVSTVDLAWKRNDTVTCNTMLSCSYAVSVPSVIKVKVDSANSLVLTKNPIRVYKKPIVYFRIGDNYHGEYGFDDSSHNHPILRDSIRYKAGTEIKAIGTDTAYFVPWMSLLDGQSALIKLEIKWLESFAAKDSNFSVKFVASNVKIKANGNTNLNVNSYNELQSMGNINISANEWQITFDSLKTIGNICVIANTGDTIGKLNLSCGKPRERKIVLVFVNTGSGYRRDLTRANIIDSLNKYSHNQIFRKWVIDTVNSSNGKDTIDLSNEFVSENAIFMNDDSILNNVERYYRLHKGIDIKYDVNQGPTFMTQQREKVVHYVFMMNYRLASFGVDQTVGNTQRAGYLSVLWSPAFYQTIAHEMGHILGLRHPFPDVNLNGTIRVNYGTTQGTTKNFMDYAAPGMPDLTDMFYFANWKDIYR
jgi:hypothetical protein